MSLDSPIIVGAVGDPARVVSPSLETGLKPNNIGQSVGIRNIGLMTEQAVVGCRAMGSVSKNVDPNLEDPMNFQVGKSMWEQLWMSKIMERITFECPVSFGGYANSDLVSGGKPRSSFVLGLAVTYCIFFSSFQWCMRGKAPLVLGLVCPVNCRAILACEGLL
ncbi:hypothetical protein V6N13_087486 [Hibiscus sabdariffa]